jgi:ribosome recycling factor
MVKDVLKDLEKKMKASLDHFRKELSRVRTGRANLGIFEDIKVDYYGVATPVNQMAKIGIPDPTLITVQPYDHSLLEGIDKAIRAAGLGLNPINDGKLLKIPVPPLDEERRSWRRKGRSPRTIGSGASRIFRRSPTTPLRRPRKPSRPKKKTSCRSDGPARDRLA